ncbi:hypothetical protein HUU05_24175 [candidate division KSB1 bacterium]|nr:hypothetical protein [candidate division KSB1 bacterium]
MTSIHASTTASTLSAKSPHAEEAIIAIKPQYHNLLRNFGNPVELANYAIESYLVTKILKYIEECKAEIKKHEAKFGCSYEEFYGRITSRNGKEPAFILQLEKEHPTYEDDFMTWGAFHRELEKWNDEMKKILAS